LRSFVEKAVDLLNHRVHLLVIDLFPPGPHDPQGIHGAIWAKIAGEEVVGDQYVSPSDQPLTLSGYEAAQKVTGLAWHVAVNDSLPSDTVFLEAGSVPVPLEDTYQTAFANMPRRWRRVLEA
jgi:hypothetical protein